MFSQGKKKTAEYYRKEKEQMARKLLDTVEVLSSFMKVSSGKEHQTLKDAINIVSMRSERLLDYYVLEEVVEEAEEMT